MWLIAMGELYFTKSEINRVEASDLVQNVFDRSTCMPYKRVKARTLHLS